MIYIVLHLIKILLNLCPKMKSNRFKLEISNNLQSNKTRII